MKVPQAFLETCTAYLNKMCEKGKIPEKDFNTLALTVFSATFGYTFLRASFGKELTDVEKEQYIRERLIMTAPLFFWNAPGQKEGMMI